MKSWYGEYQPGFVHERFAILVDKEALDSVMGAKPPGTWIGVDARTSNVHVVILDMWWFDLAEQGETLESDDDAVAWRKVLVTSLYPRFYSFAINDLWFDIMERPPDIARLD
jgi:hypothetical protein